MQRASEQHAEDRLPIHVAIIMDGNGRWAKARSLPRAVGHQRGAEAVRRTVTACRELGIRYLTLYAFSSENWKRPATEVSDLMQLLRVYLRKELNELHRNRVRVAFIGDRLRLASDIQSLILEAESKTAENQGLHLIIALNYGAQAEIVEACREIARNVLEGKVTVDAIDEGMFARHLQTVGIPEPDIVIRTSGEQRLSNFLLWQSAYSELVFMDTLWPDFSRESLEAAIDEYQRRERRYGATSG